MPPYDQIKRRTFPSRKVPGSNQQAASSLKHFSPGGGGGGDAEMGRDSPHHETPSSSYDATNNSRDGLFAGERLLCGLGMCRRCV